MPTVIEIFSGIPNELKQYYSKKMLDVANTDLLYERFADKTGIPSREGKSVNWRRFERFTITVGSYTLSEGTAPMAVNATINSVSATISQYGQHAQISDLLETQAIDPLLTQYAERFGEAMKEGRDVVVRAELSNITTIQYADTAHQVGTSGTGSVGSGNYLDSSEILEAKRTLRRNGAKPYPGLGFVCLIHPDNDKDLKEDPDIVDNLQYAGDRGASNPLISGEDSWKWAGVTFIVNNNLLLRTSYGMSGADTYEVVMFGQNLYGVTELSAQSASLIIHPRGTGGHIDPLDQKSTVGWKTAMAAKILNNNFGVLIHCASSRSNAS